MEQDTQEVVRHYDPYPQSIFTDFSGDIIKGIEAGNKAFSFPQIIQLDLTNNCNLNCVGCWCHSELMGKLKFRGEWKMKHLPKDTVLTLIEQAAENGTREIQLSGSGDPMMYPYFMEIVRAIKEKGLVLHLITNFTLVSKEILKEFAEIGVDRITLSLWAGTAETYVKTHPNQTEKTFERIRENLLHLASLKKEHSGLPVVKIYNVISNKNYHELEEMINFALDTQVEFIEFQVADIVKGKSDSLKLSEQHMESMVEQFRKLKKKENYFTFGNEHNDEFIEFGRFYRNTLPEGFRVEENSKKIRCPKDYFSSARNVTKTSLDFAFSQGMCIGCDRKSICYSTENPFKLSFLRILGFGSLYRRISSIKDNKKQKYDINIVDRMPCYIGWTFTRILPNGDVLPC